VVWLAVSSYMIYAFVIEYGAWDNMKWWTFVEGIVWWTSFLPFLWNDSQSIFYQGLLFGACLEIDMTENGPIFVDDICKVNSRDNRVFDVEINQWHIWSDWTPVNIDDIFFTYNSLIKSNAWAVPWNVVYRDIDIEKISDTSIRVIFPKASIDNKLFFSYRILPRHILSDRSFNYYREEFVLRPIYNRCASIRQSNDPNSLVIDISNCNNTNLWFYQIKNLWSFDSFYQDYLISNRSIIDAYYFGSNLDAYIRQPIINHAYMAMFFNTESDRIRVRLRRALAGLIQDNFYTEWYEDFIRRDQWIFDNFMSTGENIKEFLTRVSPDSGISRLDLIESGVRELTWNKLSFDEKNRRTSYYLERNINSLSIDITTTNAYDSIGMMYGEADKWKINNYNKSNKKASWTVAGRDISQWLNTFTIYAVQDNKKVNIWSIVLYVLTDGNIQWEGIPNTSLNVLYQDNEYNRRLVDYLKEIFVDHDVFDFFVWDKVSTRSEFENKLLEGSYDIALVSIDRWLRRDFSPILRSSDPTINPSKYVNSQFSSLFEQYIESDSMDRNVLDRIVALYTRDVPFMIFGKKVENLYVKNDVYERVFQNHTWVVFENNWRNMIFDNLYRSRNISIDRASIWWFSDFVSFVWNNANVWNHESMFLENIELFYDEDQFVE